MGAVFTSRDRRRGHRPPDRPPLARGDLVEAVRAAYAELEGHFAFVAMALDEPDTLVGARKECPLVVGLGEGETFLASADPRVPAPTRATSSTSRTARSSWSRADGAHVPDARRRRRSSARSTRSTGTRRPPRRAATRRSCSRRSTSRPTPSPRRSPTAPSRGDGVDLADGGGSTRRCCSDVERDHHRRLRHLVPRRADRPLRDRGVGARARSRWTSPPSTATATRSSARARPRHRHHAVRRDGRHAGRHAPRARARRDACSPITNIMGSQATRDADGVLYTRAGLEIGVAATKTFVCQVAVLYLLALRARRAARHAGARAARRLVAELKHAARTASTSCSSDARGRRGASPSATPTRSFFLYLGRHVGLPVALEGALKLKEITYIPTDAYAAGEMKHGPIALLDEATPVVVRGHRLADPRQDGLQRPGGPRARRARDRGRHRGQRGDRRARRGGHLVPAHRLDAAAAAGRHPAAAAGLPRSPACAA